MLSEEERQEAKTTLWPYAVSSSIFQDLYKDLVPPKMNSEDIKGLSDSILSVHKHGMKLPMSWEALVGSERKGHYEPTGNKYTQWLSWWFGKQVFRFWQFTERRLQRFRHYEGVSGYEWEDGEYRKFSQKRKWVEDAED